MHAIHSRIGQRRTRSQVARARVARPKMHVTKQVFSLGLLYAHALAIEHEAQARYREFADHMADRGNDSVAQLFTVLAESETEHARHLAKKGLSVKIPPLAPEQYAWLDSGAPLPEARAFVYSMMTPRLALQIALLAEERSKAFFERVGAESRHADVRKLAGELARDEMARVTWVKQALARQPQPYQPNETQPGDPTIEQRT